MQAKKSKIKLVIHGGAGTIKKENMTEEKAKAHRKAIKKALKKGYKKLQNGKSSLEGVETAIKVLENNPLFNAGKGAVFTNEGKNELDASIMEGKKLKAGAVAAATQIKNPISGARKVLEHSPHVMLSGKGADAFAQDQGLEMVDQEYYKTEKRWKQYQKSKERGEQQLDHSEDDVKWGQNLKQLEDNKYGTVGAVAVDQKGNLAAGTSTGGLTNKKFGRIGDSPTIGAGTYAKNKTCAVSATGHGEYFMRQVAAYQISALMEFNGMGVREAARQVVMKTLKDMGGAGGVIAIDNKGKVAMPFNTPGMYRGYIDADGKVKIGMYKDDKVVPNR